MNFHYSDLFLALPCYKEHYSGALLGTFGQSWARDRKHTLPLLLMRLIYCQI